MKCYIFSMCLNEIAIIWHQFSFNLLKVNFWKIILLKHEKTYFKNTYSLTIIILIFNKYYVLWSPFENWNKLRVLSHLNNACLCDTLKFFNNILNIPDNAHTGFGGCKVLLQNSMSFREIQIHELILDSVAVADSEGGAPSAHPL